MLAHIARGHPETEAVALDFAGTVTMPDARCRPNGTFVADVLRSEFDVTVDEAFIALYDNSIERYYVESLSESLPQLLRDVAARLGITLPDMDLLISAIWKRCGDHPIHPDVATAVQDLHKAGLTCILASNTVRPAKYRAQTLRKAGLEFLIPVCSSAIGVAKPHARFYDAVISASGVDNPARILFVGDNILNDVSAPIASGMRAAWVNKKRPGTFLPSSWQTARSTSPTPLN